MHRSTSLAARRLLILLLPLLPVLTAGALALGSEFQHVLAAALRYQDAEALIAVIQQAMAPEYGRLATSRTFDLATSLSRRLTSIHSLAILRSDQFPSVEYLVALRPDGTVLWQLRGGTGYVLIEREADAALYVPDARLVLVHNHPTSTSLSLADLENLAKPGVAAMVVIGHDGSVYMAERGEAYDAVRLGGSLYALARFIVSDQLDRDRPRMPVPPAAISAHLDHLALLALHQVRMLRYQSVLGDDRRRSYREYLRPFGRAVEAARGKVRAALR